MSQKCANKDAKQPDHLSRYRSNPAEVERTKDLLEIVPKEFTVALDIGARDGHFSSLLTDYFQTVVAIDLMAPEFNFERVERVQADATKLPFADRSFEVVFCAEVLEHIPDLEDACSEIQRVARHAIVLGVPFEQDTRLGRTTCRNCGTVNPPWGHVNAFDEQKLSTLFSKCKISRKSFVGETKHRTNFLSAWLLEAAGNPWGVYDQEEPCIICGKHIDPPLERSLWQRLLAAGGERLHRVQQAFTPTRPNWIHLVLSKMPE